MSEFTKKDILESLDLIAERLKSSNKTADIGIYGGSAVILLWEFRKSTRDIDIMIRNGAEDIKNIAKNIAAQKDYPEDWLSDQVKTFTSINHKERLFLEIPKDEPSLRIFVPTTKYLLAMKCLAMRHETDIEDVKNLIKLLPINREDDVINIIDKYYPYDAVPDRTLFGIKKIFKEMKNEKLRSNEDAFAQDMQNRQEQKKGKGWGR